MIKDFLWWLLKENIAVNYIYREWFSVIFPKKFSFNEPNDKQIQNKDTVLQARNSSKYIKPIFSIKGYSSGTTNKPLTVYRSFKSLLLEEYIVKSYLKGFGAPLRPKIAVLRGDYINTEEGTYWKKQPFTRRLILSSYHLSENTVGSYFKELERYQPNVIMAYPSSITLLAKYAIRTNWQPNWELSGILTSSETFSKENQQIVRSVFKHVYDHYGQAERVAALQQCSKGNYHVREDYSLVEFISDEHGIKIVGSNFYNNAMPLSRYDTQDYVEGLNQKGECECGNVSSFVNRILGRDDDYIVLSDGRQIGRLDIVFKEIDALIECQLEQTLLTELVVKYVPEQDASYKQIESSIKEGLIQRLGEDINILFTRVNCIPRTKAGKFRSVIRNKAIRTI